ncbi:MAG: hypothetical protein U1F35_10570 [Steroidobacteraceae bacterium]
MSGIARLWLISWLGIGGLASSLAGDDEQPAAPASALATLSDSQRQALGITVARAPSTQAPARLSAVGVVVDVAALVSQWGELASAQAAASAAAAELSRLTHLRESQGSASDREVQAGRAAMARASGEAQAQRAKAELQWRPLWRLTPAGREALFVRLRAGTSLLLRAEVPGRQSMLQPPVSAQVSLDGIEVAAKVLGFVSSPGGSQGSAVLLESAAAPGAPGAGARLPTSLLWPSQSGRLVPAQALLYDERGAFLYKALATGAGSGKARYAATRVRVLAPLADEWLVDGLDAEDEVVVRGAGVLWSLQGVGTSPADDDDQD